MISKEYCPWGCEFVIPVIVIVHGHCLPNWCSVCTMWFIRLARFRSLAPDWNWTCPRVFHGEPVNIALLILEDVWNIATWVGVMQLSEHSLTLSHLYSTAQAAAAISNVCRSFMILNYEFYLHLLNHWCIQTSNTARRIFRCRHRSTKKMYPWMT